MNVPFFRNNLYVGNSEKAIAEIFWKILDKAEELKLRTAERAAGKKIRRPERGGHSSATLKELDRTHSMTPLLRHSITSLPTELLELVCSFLNARWAHQPSCCQLFLNQKYWQYFIVSVIRDITKVEAVCRHLRARLREGRVWKAHAERFTLRYGLKISVSITKYTRNAQKCDH